MLKGKYDKPSVKNTAGLLLNATGGSDNAADELRNKILSSENATVKARKCWYISNNGNDAAAGDSEENAWATLKALEKHADLIKFGDAVLLERGGVFRGSITAQNGVYYGAYGSGDKPCIYVSRMNYAEAAWECCGENLWKIHAEYEYDMGIVVFNHGERIGYKKTTLDEVKRADDFYCENNTVWLACNGNPSAVCKSIEMGDLTHTVMMGIDAHDITVENLTMKYGGGMAVQAVHGVKNITVRNCEIGWIGGCYLPNYGNGFVRFGNGIEFWNGCENILVENNWIYQIYDSGFSHQGNGIFVQKDIVFKNNLVEYTSFGSIEYWTNDRKKNSMENITYSDNILRFAGMGWGDTQRPDVHAYHILSTGEMDHKCSNFKITGNIMDTSARGLICCTSKAGTLPEISGNTYIQKNGGILGEYGTPKETLYMFTADCNRVLSNTFHDSTATVKFL